MATAVLDMDIEGPSCPFTGLERYSKALILIRLRRRPIGHVIVPVVGGRIHAAEFREALAQVATQPFCDQWLHDFVGRDDTPYLGFTPPRATVAVCTRDRPEDLRRCLDALGHLPDEGQEVLVVDNCPSGEDTRRVVADYPAVRYVREDRPGASAARNRALREARHEIVAFSDDDAAPDPGWLRALLRNFGDPLVLCVTGLTMPMELETEAQEAFERHCPFGRGYKRVLLDGAEHNPLHVGAVGTSANMALRKSIQTLVGFYDEALGPGTPACTGEDFEMFSRILTSGYRIVYDPAALSWHRHRRTWTELRNAVYGHGVGVYGYLMRTLLVDRQFGAPSVAWGWFRHRQLPSLIHSLLGSRDGEPLDLLLSELRGCLAGPWAYLSSCRRLSKRRTMEKPL